DGLLPLGLGYEIVHKASNIQVLSVPCHRNYNKVYPARYAREP
ncbi:hypothetical protein Taro_027170, partial [Colocasia esculenta]|nr:hypothetical protein [Colocasia esculenta]